ncbi:hypothetical protein JI58_07335 [Marinosulfonomonas sp. PRT-SC04]|nr:hypothetical protein JI58_07335 [Marinosulfonomonas sp. PRT-SC04]
MVDETSTIIVQGVKIGGTVNANLLCVSREAYSIDMHRSILCPSSNGYVGNPDLVGYVTFNTKKLLKAIYEISVRKFMLPRSENALPWLSAGCVLYRERERIEHIQSGQMGISWDPIFCKPTIYSPEKEYRIIVNPDFPKPLQAGADAFCLKGGEILDAMCFEPRCISDEERDAWLR